MRLSCKNSCPHDKENKTEGDKKAKSNKIFEQDGLTAPFENKLIFQNNRKVKTEGSIN